MYKVIGGLKCQMQCDKWREIRDSEESAIIGIRDCRDGTSASFVGSRACNNTGEQGA